MEEVVYTSDSELRSPGRFAAGGWADLRAAPPVAWRLFVRGLQANYRQSWLGYLWLLAPPLATTATWVYLHAADVLEVGPTRLPYPAFVLTGAVLWQVFAEALNAPLQQLTAARNLLTRSRVPHEALLLAGLYEVLFNFAVRLAVLLPVLVWFKLRWDLPAPGASLLMVPLGVLALVLLGFAVGLLLAPVGLLYKDVSRGLGLAAVFWFFLTPVIYPAPAGGGSLLLKLNPVTPLLEATRNWLTAGPDAPARGFLLAASLTLPLLLVAWLFQRLARPHVVTRLG